MCRSKLADPGLVAKTWYSPVTIVWCDCVRGVSQTQVKPVFNILCQLWVLCEKGVLIRGFPACPAISVHKHISANVQ